MFSKIIVSGDSFSSGYGLQDPKKAWPCILANKLSANIINLAREGMGNEHIFQSIVNYKSFNDSLVICGLTHYNRIEFIDAKTFKKFTTIPNRRSQTQFEKIFYHDHYDDEYYHDKFITQLEMFTAWLDINNLNYLLFDALPINHYKELNFSNYLWNGEHNMCDIIYPHQLPDGHPDEIGHEKMADVLFKIILDKFG